MDIKIQVLNQKAKITNRHELYSGTVAIEGIQFEFSDEWADMTKTATVYVGAYDRDEAVNILLENDRVAPVQLPAELFEKNCELYVGVFGIDADGRRLTSSIVRQEVKKGVPVQSASDNVSIDVYTRIIQLMTEAKDIAADTDGKIESNKKYVEQATEQAEKSKQYAESAESHLSDVERVADNVSEMQKAIEELKTAAEKSASDALTSEQKAKESEQNASTSEQKAKESEQNASKSATNALASASNAKKSETAAATAEQNARKLIEQLTEDVSQLKESIVDLADSEKEEIDQKGLEVLQSIPEDYSELSDATLIKPTVSGTDMVLTDSSNMNIQELHLFGKTEQRTTTGKNLFNANEIFSTFIEDGRATVTDEGVLLNGTFGATTRNFSVTLKKGTYYISGGGVLHILDPSDSTFDKKIIVDEEEKTFQCYIASNTYSNKLIQPQIETGSAATAYETYTGGVKSPNPEYPQEMSCIENPTVSVAGKNLLPNNAISKTIRNLIYTVNEDKSISVNGTYTLGNDVSEPDLYLFGSSSDKGKYLYLPKGKYSINKLTIPNGIYIAREKTKGAIITTENIIKALSEQDCYFYGFLFRITKDATLNSTIYPQIEVGNTITAYEPYKEIQSAQPTCELNGIEDVKDELIVRADGTGQFIQRTLKEEINENSNLTIWYETNDAYGFGTTDNKWLFRENRVNIKANQLQGITKEVGNSGSYNTNGIFISQSGRINFKILKKYINEYSVEALKTYLKDNPIEVVGLLAEPIVTELSAEEVQKILNLKTYKSYSTIWNDKDADMQITYVADAKKYIDNKFTELSNAIIASASEAE